MRHPGFFAADGERAIDCVNGSLLRKKAAKTGDAGASTASKHRHHLFLRPKRFFIALQKLGMSHVSQH